MPGIIKRWGAQRRPDTTPQRFPASPSDLPLRRSLSGLSLETSFFLPFPSMVWEGGNPLPVQLKVWGKGEQLPGAREGLQCSPDYQLSSNVCVLRLKALREEEEEASRRRGFPSGPSWLCPLESLEQGRPAHLPGWLNGSITSIPSSQLSL